MSMRPSQGQRRRLPTGHALLVAAVLLMGSAHAWVGVAPIGSLGLSNGRSASSRFPSRDFVVVGHGGGRRATIQAGITSVMMTTGGPVGKWRAAPEVELDEDEVWEDDGTTASTTDEGEEDESPPTRANTRKEGEFVVGGGALRGEQEFYSVKDLQAMRVPRLKSMCEARGLKKAGTKQELIDRLVTSTSDQMAEDGSATFTPPGGARGFYEDGDEMSMGELEEDGVMGMGSSDSMRRYKATTAMSLEYATDPDFRPKGDQLKAILDAPKIRYKGGRSYTHHTSKLDKYEPDRTGPGSSFSGMSQQDDSGQTNTMHVTPGDGSINKELKISRVSPGARTSDRVESAQATTLNNIPREFIPPALRSYDPQAQSKRRGPGRPKQDAEDAEDGNRLSDWEVVKKGGGLENNPQVSPFDAMIAADEAEEERLGLTKRKRGRAKKTTTTAAVATKKAWKKGGAVDVDEDDDEDDDDLEDDMAFISKMKSKLAIAGDDDDDEDDKDDVDDEMPDLEDDDDIVKKISFEDDDDDDTIKFEEDDDDTRVVDNDEVVSAKGKKGRKAAAPAKRGRKPKVGTKASARVSDDDDDDADAEEVNDVW